MVQSATRVRVCFDVERASALRLNEPGQSQRATYLEMRVKISFLSSSLGNGLTEHKVPIESSKLALFSSFHQFGYCLYILAWLWANPMRNKTGTCLWLCAATPTALRRIVPRLNTMRNNIRVKPPWCGLVAEDTLLEVDDKIWRSDL